MEPTPEGLSPEPETPAVTNEEASSRSPSKSFGQRLAAVFRADSGVFAEIAEDPRTLNQALLVAAGAAALSGGLVSLMLFVIAIPVMMVVIALYALMLWMAMKLLADQDLSYSSTFRVVAFATAPNALGIIPLVGAIAGAVYTLVLHVVAISQIARVSIGKAVGIFFLSFVIFAAIILVVTLVFGLSIATLSNLESFSL